jgi:xanthine dehydrogenase YagT iron-sulfur-binding subunit
MKKTISLKVNGSERSVEVEARTTLLDMVREQFGLTGARLGCDIQVCGACTLLVDGSRSARVRCWPSDVDGAAVETIEGISKKDALHPLQEAFMEFGALRAATVLPDSFSPRRRCSMNVRGRRKRRFADYLAGNFCRCGCYQEIVQGD